MHLQAANGTMLPVTLNISSKEDMINGRVSHVVQVRRLASWFEQKAFNCSPYICTFCPPSCSTAGRLTCVSFVAAVAARSPRQQSSNASTSNA